MRYDNIKSKLAWDLTSDPNYQNFLYNRVSIYIPLKLINYKTSKYVYDKITSMADTKEEWDKIGELFSEFATKNSKMTVSTLKMWADSLSFESLVEAINFTYEISPVNNLDTSFYKTKSLIKPTYMVELRKKFGFLDTEKVFINKSTGDFVVVKKINDLFYVVANCQEDIDRFKLFLEQLKTADN